MPNWLFQVEAPLTASAQSILPITSRAVTALATKQMGEPALDVLPGSRKHSSPRFLAVGLVDIGSVTASESKRHYGASRPVAPAVSKRYHVDLSRLPGGELRRAPDGWHAIVSLGGANHRLWLQELPPGRSLFAVELQLDSNFDIRSQAAHRFWSALEERPLGPPLLRLPVKRRQRQILAMRALDGWLEGNSYRDIAAGLFGRHAIPDLGWKTHDLRNRTIRLVKKGLSMMRGGYRALLRRPSRKK